MGDIREHTMIGGTPLRRWACVALLTAATGIGPGTVSAGERCESHFPKLRGFVELAGSRGTPDVETASTLLAELAVERALWNDEASRHRVRLEAVGASLGLARLNAIDAEISAALAQLDTLLKGGGALEEAITERLLTCGGDPQWRIRSVRAPTIEGMPAHRAALVAEHPPDGYHDPPEGAIRTTTKAQPSDVWPEDPLHPVAVKAAELDHDPVELYRFVLNEIRAEHSIGATKSPGAVLISGRGNDADQARLLAKLLRASGYPARLARGVVEFPTDRLIEHFSVADHHALEAMLTETGAAWSPIGGGVRPAAYRVERTWCEVWIAYADFRGLELDDSGPTWAVLDPHFEDRAPLGDRRLLTEIAFSAENFLDDYLGGAYCEDDLEQPGACPAPRQILASMVNDHLAGIGSTDTYESLSSAPSPVPDDLSILPASMPGHVASVEWIGLEPPIETQHRMRITARDGGRELLNVEVPLSELTGREAAMWFEPATPEDEQIVRAYDYNLWSVPPYLLHVTPVIVHRGGEVARGHDGLGMGRVFELEVTLTAPDGTSAGFVNTELAGAPAAIGIGGGASGYEPVGPEPTSSLELLSTLAEAHLVESHRFASELAVVDGHGLACRRPSVLFIGNEVDTDGALGLIETLTWKGLTTDVDLWGPRAVGGDDESRHAWRTTAQLGASAFERSVFEAYGVTSVSADLALILAETTGGEILTINAGNAGAVLPGLPFPSAVLNEIEGWVSAGGEALVPADVTTLLEWEGVGYMLIDTDTGAARYQLAGGLSGGSTTMPPDEAADGFGMDLWPPTRFPVNEDPLSVAVLRKLAGFDGIEGTVGDEAEADLRVEALDREGARVVGVPVTFFSMAGGGDILDPAGVPGPELEVLTDDHGVATARLRFGTDTSENAWYSFREPTDEHLWQVALHMVDAVGHGEDDHGSPVGLPVEGPFWAVAFPGEAATFRRTDTPETSFTGRVAQWVDTIFTTVEDQYGNPVSNHPVTFSAQPFSIDETCTNELPPEDQLGAVVFDNLWHGELPPCGGHPVLGSCGDPMLAKSTTYTGASAGVIEGNVFPATYPVSVTASGLPTLSFTYTQRWVIYAETGACDVPDKYAISSHYLSDEYGNNVNAAAPNDLFGPSIDFWIEHYLPEPRPDEDPPFYAGGGQWWAACADDLQLDVSNGGQANPPQLDPTDWSYHTQVTAGPQPDPNDLRALSSNARFCVGGGLIPFPLDENFNRVWTVLPEVTGFDPNPVEVSSEKTFAQTQRINYTVLPEIYPTTSVAVEILDTSQHSQSFWPGSNRFGSGSVTIPRGEPIDPNHEVVASVVVNHGHQAEVRSNQEPIPFFQSIFGDVTKQLQVSQLLDVLNRTACPKHDVFSFHVNHRAAVTLTVTRQTPVGPGAPEVVFSQPALEEGDYQLTVAPSSSTPADITLLPGSYDVELHGVSFLTGDEETVPGVAISSLSSTDSLPVGHVMVKGVDLLDGHLVLSREDFSVPTRGVPLSFERSYSSASDAPGHLGRGWTHNWLARIVRTPCGELLLIGTEGSGMRFTPDGVGRWKPPLGHHGTLVFDGEDGSEIDYFTTGGTRYHFLPGETPDGLPLGEWRLSFVEDPSGNAVGLHYEEGGDGLPRVQRVVGPAGRELVLTYENRTFLYWGGDVLTKVEGPSFVEVVFEYDERGNLILASREKDVRTEHYDHDDIAFRQVLTHVTNELNGADTEYQFRDSLFGVADEPLAVLQVEQLIEPEGEETRFFYDFDALAANGPELTTWVRDPRDPGSPPPAAGAPGPFDTTYTMNRYGSPTKIRDPLGNATTMVWADDDIVMESRTDANEVTTAFSYDAHGNLLTETVTVTDVDGAEHEYEVVNTYAAPSGFDPPHIKNRVATHTDRNGAETSFAYDADGNLLSSTISVTPVTGPASVLTTSHTYDTNGDRLSTTDARGHTTTFNYNTFGNLGNASIDVTDHTDASVTVATSSEWDILSRPVSRTDPKSHTTSFIHDNLGRLTSTTHPEVEIDEGVFWQPVEAVAYDDAANTVTATDGRGHSTTTTFDLEGRVKQIDNPEGGAKIILYDLAGNKRLESSVFDADTPRRDTVFEYDAAGRLTRRIESEGRITNYDYDPAGNLVRETLSSSFDQGFVPRVTEHAYDELNRRIRSVRDPPPGLATTTEIILDGEGNAVLVRDPEGRETNHTYDELGRLIATTGPDWRPGQPQTNWFYFDGNGNLEREIRLNERFADSGSWESANQTRSTTFDELNRPIIATDAEGHQGKVRYDLSGNTIEEIDRRGHIASHTHDALNRRTSTTRHLTDPDTGVPWNVTAEWIHDAAGNLRIEHWPNGSEIIHEYNALNRLTSTSDTIGRLVSVAYDARGNRVLETNGRGNATEYEYDALDRLLRTSIPGISSHTYSWDVAGNRIQWFNGRGARTDEHYDTLDRLVRAEYPEVDGVRHESSATYDLVGNRISATDPNGHTTWFDYDGLNRVVAVHDPAPLSYSVTTTFDAVGNRVAETDRRGIASRWVFDLENRIAETHRDGQLIASTSYDTEGNAEDITDALGFTTHTTFDERNLARRIEQPEGSTIHLRHDAMGDSIKEIDGEGRTTLRGYDFRRRLVSEANGSGETTRFAYDGAGNLETVTRPLGGIWTRSYDGAERLQQVIDPLDHATSYAYDTQNNLTNVLDAGNQTTVLEYDPLDRLTRVIASDGSPQTFTYDGNGNRLAVTDPKNQIVTSVYDELNRETLRSFTAPTHSVGEVLQSIGCSWDGNSNLVDAVETYSTGTRLTHHEWDRFDRLSVVTDGFGKTLAYGYDLNGNRTSLTDPDDLVTSYAYDGLNRLDTVTLPAGVGTADYDWYRNGLLRRVAYPNGTAADYGFDQANRVTSIENSGIGGDVLSSFGYDYDANGNRSVQRELNGGTLETTGYLYDLADRLWQVAYPDQTTTYSLDAVGNRSSERSVGPSDELFTDRGFSFDSRHRLTRIDDHLDPSQSVDYGYDLNGNQTSRSQAGTTLDFRYDARDQILEVDHNGSQAWTFSFDFRGLRVTKWGADGLLNITYDDHSVLQQHSAMGDPVATYRYGPDRLLATDHHSQGLAYYHFDALGSIANLTDPAGAVLNRYQYDAWGRYRSQTGAHWNPFGFTGHEYDNETGLYYAKARFYDPEVGRFLSEDPAEPDLTTPPSLHRYLYAYGNPTVWIDPLGRNVVDPRFKVDDRFPHYEFEDQIYAVNPLNGEVYRQHATRYSALDPNDPDQAETIAVINSMTGASLPENYWRLQTMYEMAGHQLTEAEEKQAQREIASAAVGFTPGLETAQELAIFATGKDPVTGRYVGAGEYVANTIGMALPFVSLRGGKHLFKSGSKRVSRSKNKAFIVDESGGMRAVVRNIDTGNEYVIAPRRGTGATPGDAPGPPRSPGGAQESPSAFPDAGPPTPKLGDPNGQSFGSDLSGSGTARAWNEFQQTTKGQFASRTEAATAWNVYKTEHGISTGVVRSKAAKRSFLKQLYEAGKAPKWMNQWLRDGKVPPGFQVDHIKALSDGGPDNPANMRLLDKAFHDLHHSPGHYRPWE